MPQLRTMVMVQLTFLICKDAQLQVVKISSSVPTTSLIAAVTHVTFANLDIHVMTVMVCVDPSK